MLAKIIAYRPPRIALSFMAIATGLHFLSPVDTSLPGPTRGLGGIMFIAGFGLMMWAWMHFQRTQNDVCVTGQARLLIQAAPYSYSRNPMYLGMLLMLLGVALALGSVIALVAPAAFFLTINNIFIPFEERQMERLFGEDYQEFRRRVRRWL